MKFQDCQDCAYFHRPTHEDPMCSWGYDGYCRRYPPTPVKRVLNDEIHCFSKFPPVHCEGMGCGEWLERPVMEGES